jgi:hypothetical protein
MIYQFAAKKTNIAIENIIFVDDRLSFVQGAEAVNMNAWLIERPVQDPSLTKPLVKNKIEDLRELFRIINFPENEMVSNNPGQSQLSVHEEKFWDFCELPINNSSTSFFEETNYAGRKAAIPAYISGLTK